jgi:hypothetical protein
MVRFALLADSNRLVVSALFASWFGYILWPIAYFRMSRGRSLKDPKHASQVVLCIILFIAGKSHTDRRMLL